MLNFFHFKISTDHIYDIDLTLDVLTSNNENKNNEIKNFVIDDDKYKTSDLIEKIKNDPDIAESFEEINLHNCEFSQLTNNILRSFRSLRKLILSFNNLNSLKDLNYLVSVFGLI